MTGIEDEDARVGSPPIFRAKRLATETRSMAANEAGQLRRGLGRCRMCHKNVPQKNLQHTHRGIEPVQSTCRTMHTSKPGRSLKLLFSQGGHRRWGMLGRRPAGAHSAQSCDPHMAVLGKFQAFKCLSRSKSARCWRHPRHDALTAGKRGQWQVLGHEAVKQ